MDGLGGAEAAIAAHKRTIGHSEALLDCAACPPSASVTMLVIMVAEKLIGAIQHISTLLLTHTAVATECGGSEEKQTLKAEVRERGVALGAYTVDAPDEWAWILQVLCYVQLRRLDNLLTRALWRAEEAREPLQVQIAEQQETRLRAALRTFQRATLGLVS
ncbi:hypothetical protein MPH_10167 [Macrophomina phaseolina MS6]|uniref:Uncharacterized protein n=1 Tax=Macrophomina phaseolina (strain MS6) TaxID=1126212 RepID=K2RR68_MACPH|nr:hypothetical protein MPH_10167 [Macrophomina phaseolina MS6]